LLPNFAYEVVRKWGAGPPPPNQIYLEPARETRASFVVFKMEMSFLFGS